MKLFDAKEQYSKASRPVQIAADVAADLGPRLGKAIVGAMDIASSGKAKVLEAKKKFDEFGIGFYTYEKIKISEVSSRMFKP
jgi:hypothetical protein